LLKDLFVTGLHPDKNKAPGSTEAFQKLQQMRDRAILDREWFERATAARI